MTKIYLVRHCRALLNYPWIAKQFTKDYNPGTNPELCDLDVVGKAQAAQVAENIASLVNEPFALYASPVSCAVQTAEAIGAPLNIRPVIDKRFSGRRRCFETGHYCGNDEEIINRVNAAFNDFTLPNSVVVSHGETIDAYIKSICDHYIGEAQHGEILMLGSDANGNLHLCHRKKLEPIQF